MTDKKILSAGTTPTETDSPDVNITDSTVPFDKKAKKKYPAALLEKTYTNMRCQPQKSKNKFKNHLLPWCPGQVSIIRTDKRNVGWLRMAWLAGDGRDLTAICDEGGLLRVEMLTRMLTGIFDISKGDNWGLEGISFGVIGNFKVAYTTSHT